MKLVILSCIGVAICGMTASSYSASSAEAALPAVRVVAPPEAAGILNGNSYFAPFERTARFQQVYDGSVFAGKIADGGLITGFRFRVDANAGGSFDALIHSLQLTLSTTSRSADGLSDVFSENVGADSFAVFGPGSIRLNGAGGGGFTSFNVSFDFRDQPFFYDPSQGNLLLDFQIFEGFGPIGQPQLGLAVLDGFDVAGDPVSSVYGEGPAIGVLPTSGQRSSLGLATDFSIRLIPEPSTLALLAMGCGALAVCWKRERKQSHRCPGRQSSPPYQQRHHECLQQPDTFRNAAAP